MIIIYSFLINLLLIFSPFVLVYRLFKNKEHKTRFLEKLSFNLKKRENGKLIWFHTVSVGELLSIIPLIEKIENNNQISQILVTSSTLTSSELFKKFKFKKTIHQFYPIDNNYFAKKFLDNWKPSIAIFVDSEVWPNMLINLNKKKIITILLNARISIKSFKRWKKLSFFSKNLFNKFNYTYPQNKETQKHLKKLGVKNIKLIGNLKFSQKRKIINSKNLQLNNLSKNKKIWCAMSTHRGEEKICLEVYKNQIRKNKKIILVIIPRHIHRINEIKKEVNNYNLKFHLHSSKKKVSKDTNIYLVDTYGEAENFFNLCKIVFIGKSLTNKGGQNPLEAARHNCKIIHGPNISNFKEVYEMLDKKKLAKKIHSSYQLQKALSIYLSKKVINKSSNKKLYKLGNQILNDYYIELIKLLKI